MRPRSRARSRDRSAATRLGPRPEGRVAAAHRTSLAISVRRAAVDPDRHSPLHGWTLFLGVGAEEKTVEVVIADRAGRAPNREFAERPKLGDLGVDPVALRGQQPHAGADSQSLEKVFPD